MPHKPFRILRTAVRTLADRLPLLCLYILLLAMPCCLKLADNGIFHFASARLATGMAASFAPACLLVWLSGRKMARIAITVILWWLCLQEFFIFMHFGTRFSSRVIFFMMQTNPSEASDFFSRYLFTGTTMAAAAISLIPIAAYFTIKPLWFRINRRIQQRHSHRCAAITLIAAFACSSAILYAGLFTTYLYGIISLPTISQIVFATRSVGSNRRHMGELEQACLHADGTLTSPGTPSPAIIYVVGESLNKHHTPLYGYPLPTTPRLSREYRDGNLVIFTNATTPSSATEEVMDIILSPHTDNDTLPWHRQPLTPAIFRHAGYHVTYHDNQATSLQADAKWDSSFLWYFNSDIITQAGFDYRNLTLAYYDLPFIRRELKHAPLSPRSLSIFHLMGQHMPADARLGGGCPTPFTIKDYDYRKDLDNNQKKDVAVYDNAVLTTDAALSAIIDALQGRDAVLIFHSDHGEEIHDYRNQYGRTLEPVTPHIQRNVFEVPLVVYTTPEFRSAHPETYSYILRRAGEPFSLHDISAFLLHIGGVRSRFAATAGF